VLAMRTDELVARCTEVLEQLGPNSEKAVWVSLVAHCSELIRDDEQLRGGLAHHLCYFFSPSSVCKMSINALVTALADFQSQLYRISGGITHEIKDPQSIRKFIQREYDTIRDYKVYFNLLMFLVATARNDEERFFRHYVHQEVGGLRLFIGRLHSALKDRGDVNSLLEAVQSFAISNLGKRVIQNDLGGMLELGRPDRDLLWQSIFHRTKADYIGYASKPSEERYFICFRYSTFGNLTRLAKSFLVLQSPGDSREHFAFKAFYKSRTGQLRRSAGSIVALGDVVSCFGSSKRAVGIGNASQFDGETAQFVGPKALFLNTDSFRNGEHLIPGQLVSVNEDDVLFSSKIICVATYLRHSSDASIGTYALAKYDDELGKHSVFGEGKEQALSRSDRDRLWEMICSELCPQSDGRIELSLARRDVDLRKVVTDN